MATNAGDSRWVNEGKRLFGQRSVPCLRARWRRMSRGERCSCLQLSMRRIGRELWRGQLMLFELVNRLVLFVRIVPVKQVSSRLDPRHAEVGREIRSVPNRVVPPNVKVVFDVSPFLIGEQVAERRIASSNGLVAAELLSVGSSKSRHAPSAWPRRPDHSIRRPSQGGTGASVLALAGHRHSTTCWPARASCPSPTPRMLSTSQLETKPNQALTCGVNDLSQSFALFGTLINWTVSPSPSPCPPDWSDGKDPRM